MDLLLITGVLALVCGVVFGGFLARRFGLRLRRSRANVAVLPLFTAKAKPARSGRLPAQRATNPVGRPTSTRLRLKRPSRRLMLGLLVALLALVVIGGGSLFSANSAKIQTLVQSETSITLAVQLPVSGEAAQSGLPPAEGIQLAIEEANASGTGPPFKLTTYDDQGSDELARGLAEQIVASPAALVLGPAFSTTALATGPVYAKADMASLPTNATSDKITVSQTTFRVLFKNSDEGELLANYLVRVLGQKRAAVFVVDTAYGQTLREGFERAAPALGLQADYYVFTDETQADQMARQVAQAAPPPPVVLLTLDRQGARLLVALRKLGVAGPFLGGDSFGKAGFNELVKSQPEEQSQPGFFTDTLYGLTPMILDSANAAILAFAERFRVRFGHDPDWSAVAGYDAATLAVAAARATLTDPTVSHDLPTQRAAVATYLRSLNHPDKALPGLLGPFWFDESRGRPLAIRIGRFHQGRFASAPIQIVAVPAPDPAEMSSGVVFELSPGRYARMQQLVFAGVYLNAIPQADMARSRFTADFYLWLRFAQTADPGSVNPTSLYFPALLSSNFAPDQPLEQRVLEDGTAYRLWRIQGEFRAEVDLRRFPFDHQRLALSFFNPNATAEQVVYVLDPQAGVAAATPAAAEGQLAITAPDAFRTLSEWTAFSANAQREHLRINSTLGDPARGDLGTQLARSGVVLTVELERRTLDAFTNTVLPLLIMSLVLFGSLFLPSSFVQMKVLSALTAALGGIMALMALTSQLGVLGYTIEIGKLFYVFFGLVLLCLFAALSSQWLRSAHRVLLAIWVELTTRLIFSLTLVATVILTAQLL